MIDRINWKNVIAESLCSFVCHQAENRRGAGRKTPGTVVRSVIRFLEFSGELGAAMSGAIPTIRQSTHSALPRRLCTDDIERVLNAVQESGLPEAARDYAILLMLSQLGLRSCEIANLRLEDVDWAEGQILIRPGKTHQERALPLTQEVGDAIAVYVQHTRARSASRKVFLKACPPFTPFTSAAAIGHIAKRAMHRAGITVHPGMAAHTFRHTAASEMVNQGATFKDVADVLGHRSLETTGIYAKLDLNNLLQVAMPWAGEASGTLKSFKDIWSLIRRCVKRLVLACKQKNYCCQTLYCSPAAVMQAEQFVRVPPLTGQPLVARRHGVPAPQLGG